MQRIMADSSHDEPKINEIAESPTLWWGVQRKITAERAGSQPWPPSGWLKGWIRLAVPAFAALLVFTGIFFLNPYSAPQTLQSIQTPTSQGEPTLEDRHGKMETYASEPSVDVTPRMATNSVEVNTTKKRLKRDTAPVQVSREVINRTEVKSDFIALTYAERPESGHLVRVKVPSSMMVTLGLVASVETPSDLVDAEVLVGGDGMTHSIRFIRY